MTKRLGVDEISELQLAALYARLDQLEAQTTIPALPKHHGGYAITWERWEEAPVLTHVQNGCAQCNHPGPQLITFGLAGPGKPTKRFRAFRCRACQEMTVYRVQPSSEGRPHRAFIEIAYHPPRTEETAR